MDDNHYKDLILCCGLQSSGSTLASWCFLQRPDMAGVLDAEWDLLPSIDAGLAQPFAWYKTTISCFRLSELVEHYQDDGWKVRPLLMIRDVRHVWASLLHKPYGRNGITAEDPPLRMRMRRFKEDWELSRRMGWSILRYESLRADPRTSLQEACVELGLAWSEAMIEWPKRPEDIGDPARGNRSFWATRERNLPETLSRYSGRFSAEIIAADDLHWLEAEFREFNLENGYPERIEVSAPRAGRPSRAMACFEVTRRYQWEIQGRPIHWLLGHLGLLHRSLIAKRSVKKAA
jgi:hypothetical protein